MYEQFYRLKESPFRLAPDPGYFFSSPAHRRALAYLRYGLARREGFVVVTGRPGTGKTTLAQALLAEARQERVVVGNLNTTHLEADDVLRMVAAAFGLSHEAQPKATTLKRLEAFFAARVRAGEHVLLVVDEAQNLPFESLEELRMLSNFQLGNHALVQIFLLGQQQFRDMLNSKELEQLRQRVVAACHLEPLSPQETRGYIEHRLRQAGWQGNPHITDLAFGMIHAITEGIPRRINAFCDRLLLYGALEEKQTLDEQAVQAVHGELVGEGVFDHVSLDWSAVAPVPPLEEEEPTPPSGSARPVDGAPEQGTEPPPAEAERDAPQTPPLRERIQVLSGSGEAPEGGAEVRVVELPQQAPQGDRALPPAAAAALALYRDPDNNRQWLDPRHPLPEGMAELLQIAVGRTEDYAESAWVALGCDRKELQEAARHFVRQVLFAEGADYFRNLGLDHDARNDQIREHYRLLFRLLQPVEGEDDPAWSRRQVKTVNRAYNTLRNAERRAAYLNRLQSAEQDAQDPLSPPWAVQSMEGAAVAAEGPPAGGEATPPHEGMQRWLWAILVVALMLMGAGLYLVLKGDAGTRPAQTTLPMALPEPEANPIVRDALDDEGMEATPFPGGAGRAEAVAPPPAPAPRPAAQSRSPATESTASSAPARAQARSAQAPEAAVAPSRGSEAPLQSQPRPTPEAAPSVAKRESVAPAPAVEAPAETPAETMEAGEAPAPEQRAPEGEAAPSPEEATPALTALSLPVLQQLMKGLFEAYAAGDIEAFMSFFAPTAFTNDQTDLEGIRRDYLQLFRATERRSMQADLSWEMLDDNRARGEGRFVVTVLPNGAREARIVTGTLVVQVEVGADGRPRISGLFHTYDRAR